MQSNFFEFLRTPLSALNETQKFFMKDNKKVQIKKNLICINKQAYPKFNQVIIMQGQSGSGKGFVRDNLLGVEGLVLDIDDVKKLALSSEKIQQRVKNSTGEDLSKFSLKNPRQQQRIHVLLGDILGITDLREKITLNGIKNASQDRKPNLIFDVTLKKIDKLKHISKCVQQAGYRKEDIHIVWVLNDVDTQLRQDQQRERTVGKTMLKRIHKDVNKVLKELMSHEIVKYMDGEIHFVYGSSQETIESSNGGRFFNDCDYTCTKKRYEDIVLDSETITKARKLTKKKLAFVNFLTN